MALQFVKSYVKSNKNDDYGTSIRVSGARRHNFTPCSSSRRHVNAWRRWIKRLVWERGNNRAMVAVANKNARISWALLTRQEAHRFATGT